MSPRNKYLGQVHYHAEGENNERSFLLTSVDSQSIPPKEVSWESRDYHGSDFPASRIMGWCSVKIVQRELQFQLE